ncbi:killer suppression protein [Cryobacterium glaciale]|uniref:Killer suppression protein n=1 Tax=Cryobacterium glaciale TaxID=1259145 RepID=A0A4R8V0D4_9MICO|nr:type II toxin-antitoxin system RelE/ParE family toxin [Cryobacterium glaciale]TFB75308.1 killer suppression protein [Cryobacterium glaciale]
MNVGFGNAKLAKMCTTASQRVRKLGSERADKVLRRLDQLSAASNLAEFYTLPQARCHQLIGDKDEQFSIDLDGPYRLLFEIADDPIPRLSDGGIDLSQVVTVCVLEITDTH